MGLGHWLQLALHDAGPNRDGIGAFIEVRHGGVVEQREITSGGGHAGGQLGWWHFGIGSDTQAEVRVLWADGAKGDWAQVQADGFYDLTKGMDPKARQN